MDFNQTLQKNSSDRGLLAHAPWSARCPPPNAAHDGLMQKAEALVEKVAKSGSGKPMTLETAYEKVLMDPANIVRSSLAATAPDHGGASYHCEEVTESPPASQHRDRKGRV